MSVSEVSLGHSVLGHALPTAATERVKKNEKARVSQMSLIVSHTHEHDTAVVKMLLEEDRSLVNARDNGGQTSLHVAAIQGWTEVAKCLLVNAQDRWRNTPLADAEGAKRHAKIELLKPHGGLSNGKNGNHLEIRPVPRPRPNSSDPEIDLAELDFSKATLLGKGAFGEIIKATWRGTPVAVKRILPSVSDDSVIQDFKHEVNLLVQLRHPNIIQFLAVTNKPLMLVTEYMGGGDLHQHLNEKGALNPTTAINFAIDIARGVAYLHTEPAVVIHRDLKPGNVLLENTSGGGHVKIGDFGSSILFLVSAQDSDDVYEMSAPVGSFRYMAPEVFNHQRYNKKVDIFSFGMILYQMLEGVPPLSNMESYEAAKYVADGHRPNFMAKGFIPELRELTEQCWSADPNKRPSFLDILKKLEDIKDALPSDDHHHCHGVTYSLSDVKPYTLNL